MSTLRTPPSVAASRMPLSGRSEADEAYRAMSAVVGGLTSARLQGRRGGGGGGGDDDDYGEETIATPRWHSPDPVAWLRESNEGDFDDDTESMDVEDAEEVGDDDDDEMVENPLLHFSGSGKEKKGSSDGVPDPVATPVLKRPPKKKQGDAIPASSMNRSQTPVMSNTRPGDSRGGGSGAPGGVKAVSKILDVDDDYDDDDYEDDDGVALSSRGRRFPFAFASSSAGAYKPSSNAAYRRYHDALLAFCRKHNELNRPNKDKAAVVAAVAAAGDAVMEVDTNDGYIPDDADTASVEDTPARIKADVQFLAALHQLCWDTSAAEASASSSSSPALSGETFSRTRKEGNFWLLLSRLRRLGADAVCWEETAAVRHEMQEFYHFLSGLPVDESPRSVLDHLNNNINNADTNVVPFVLRRRKVILQWLETIFGFVVPDRSTWPARSGTKVLYPPKALPVTTKDRELFSVALSLMLAGRWDEARQLARDLGTPWRAAAWNGHDPYGYDEAAQKTVGNEQRPLWRRMMWLQSEHLNGGAPLSRSARTPAAALPPRQGGCPEEGALAALMSCHLGNARSNAALRTWEKGLYASLKCVWGRTEDEIVYHHNQARAVHGAALFTTTGYTKLEEDHLNSTKWFAALSELEIVDGLQKSEFVQVTSRDVCTDATAAVLAGQDPLYSYLTGCMGTVDAFMASDKEAVRFLTHLLVYLVAVCPVSTTAPQDFQETLRGWRDFLIVKYLEVLGERDGLASLYVLYASLLPPEAVLEVLPRLLVDVVGPRERVFIVGQLDEYMPDQDIEVLYKVVSMEIQAREVFALSEKSDAVLPPLSDAPNQVDLRKMKSLEWLCINPKHKKNALALANMLLRLFFLREKLGCANMFIEEYLPPDIAAPVDDAEAAADVRLTMEEARSEHAAYKSYLLAMAALKAFAAEVDDRDPTPKLLDDEFDPSKLDPPEAEIAVSAGRRQLVKDKRSNSRAVVEAATTATTSLLAVLTHPGGWLVTESNDEETLAELRRTYLSQAVFLYLRVCERTADWMSSSLDDALERLDCPTLASALRELDVDAEVRASPLNPAYWHSLALQVSVVVATDEHGVHSSMTDRQVEDLLRKLAETKVQQLKWESDLR